ncbi:uncharacterized protein A4U43_C08F9110 [Asparagus officinalis]|nr:uncharacterized protein A4U43_C08F9110 [Asparagus officinalis]
MGIVLDLAVEVGQYLSLPVLALSQLSEMSYCALERKLVLVPIPFLVAFAVAGVMKDTAAEASSGLKSDDGLLPGYCATPSDLWFDWRLAFDDDDGGGVSLISAGFSRKWTSFPDCFDCQIVSGNCIGHCRGIDPSGNSHSKWIIAGISGIMMYDLVSAVSVLYLTLSFYSHVSKRN